MMFWLKVSGSIVLGLVLLLIPVFGIYVASAQSLPGEGPYPLKQFSEQTIDEISQIYPGIYAYFSLLKSQRRYQEIIGLLEKNQDITDSNQKFIEQVRQTLFDIQSVSETSLKLNYLSQHQSFINTAISNLSYKSAFLKEKAGIDKSTIKTFTVDDYHLEDGELVIENKKLEQKSINQKKSTSPELILRNIEQLEMAQESLRGLIQK
jgi:hypothetical protein